MSEPLDLIYLVLSRLTNEIRDSRKVQEELLMWLRSQPTSNGFSDNQKKTFAELRASIESALNRAFAHTESDYLRLAKIEEKAEELARRMSSLARYAKAIDQSTN